MNKGTSKAEKKQEGRDLERIADSFQDHFWKKCIVGGSSNSEDLAGLGSGNSDAPPSEYWIAVE